MQHLRIIDIVKILEDNFDSNGDENNIDILDIISNLKDYWSFTDGLAIDSSPHNKDGTIFDIK